MTLGERDSSAAHLKRKSEEESRACWVTSTPSLRPRIWARTSLTSAKSFLNSSNRASKSDASEGPVGGLVLASLASDSFCALEGVAPFLELLVVAVWPCFWRLRGSLTLRLPRDCSFSGKGLSALSDSMSRAPLVCS